MSAEKALASAVASPVKVDLWAMSHTGKVRLNNEDNYIVMSIGRTMRTLLTSLPEGDIPPRYSDAGYGMIVADGMGGAAGGEVASRTVIGALVELALSTPDWIMRLDDELAKVVLRRLNDRIKRAAAALAEKVRMDPSLAGMGTTITIACSVGLNLLIAHVGDSRAYLFREGQLHRLTRDQTVAQALASAGVISQEDVESHPARHVLTQVVGSEGGNALAELSQLQLTDGDIILLSTDGLTDMVSEAAITKLLAIEMPASQACRALIEMALEGGGLDNITVVLARYLVPK